MARLVTCQWVRAPHKVLLTGPTGIGNTRRGCAPRVAGFAWSGWQPARGPRGRLPVDWVAGILWIEWQASRGLSGNLPMDWVADIRGICTTPLVPSRGLVRLRLFSPQ